jgi:hypothetical protein
MNVRISIILFLTLYSAALYGQQVISSAGDFYQKSSGSVSYTIGETVTETYKQGSTILTQGMQQTTLTVTAINELDAIGLTISAFPNPTSSKLILKVDVDKLSGIWFSLFDLSGKLLLRDKIVMTETELVFDGYSAGTYIMKIFIESTEVKTFKIVKQ